MVDILFGRYRSAKRSKKSSTRKPLDKEIVAFLKELESLNIKYDNATEELIANIHQRELYEYRRLEINERIVEIEYRLGKKGIIKNNDE